MDGSARISAARADRDRLDLLGSEIVFDHEIEGGGYRRVGERLGGEELHPALKDSPRISETVGEDVEFPLRIEDVAETFLAVEDMLGTGVAAFGQQRRQHPALGSQRVDGVLHHGQFACSDRARGAVARCRDADCVLHLFSVETEHPGCGDRRCGGGQGGVVPADLAHAGVGDLAQTLLELVGEGDADQQIASGTAGTLGRRHRRRDQIGGVRRVLFPVNVVVIHHPDHQGVEKRRRNRVPELTGHQDPAIPRAGCFGEHLAGDVDVVLLCTAERTADRVHQVSLGLVDDLGRKIFVLDTARPVGNGARYRGHGVPPGGVVVAASRRRNCNSDFLWKFEFGMRISEFGILPPEMGGARGGKSEIRNPKFEIKDVGSV